MIGELGERRKNETETNNFREPFHFNNYYYLYNGTTTEFYVFDVGNENRKLTAQK